jgi:hypothetical protein
LDVRSAEGSQLLVKLNDIVWWQSAQEAKNSALGQRIYQAVLGKHEAIDLIGRRDHDEELATTGAGIADGARRRASESGESGEGIRIDIEAVDLEAGLEEVGGHAEAHGSETGKGDM